MIVKLVVTPTARAAIRREHDWWRSNREKSPHLFIEELKHVLGRLRDGADAARQRHPAQGAVVWRLLMPKTRSHVYYERDEKTNEVRVLLVVNAIAEHAPDL